MMGLFLNLALLILGTVGALAAFGGDTWRREPIAWAQRVTKRGWLALVCMLLALFIGIVKEIRNNNLALIASERQVQLENKLESSDESLQEANSRLEYLNNSLDEARAVLESTRAKLASVEPSILEGIIYATTGIRRESDFTTPHLRGEPFLTLISGRFDPEPLLLYGGDFLDYQAFCESGDRREFGLPHDFERMEGRRDQALAIEVGRTYYPLRQSGRIMIIGPIGMPMQATIHNPQGLIDCFIKILVESADRTRELDQLLPLVEAIRSARSEDGLR